MAESDRTHEEALAEEYRIQDTMLMLAEDTFLPWIVAQVPVWQAGKAPSLQQLLDALTEWARLRDQLNAAYERRVREEA